MALSNVSRQPISFGRRQPAITVPDLKSRIALLQKRANVCRQTPNGRKHAEELLAIARGYQRRIDELERTEAESAWVTGGAHVR